MKVARGHLYDAFVAESSDALWRYDNLMAAANAQLPLPGLTTSEDLPVLGVQEEGVFLTCADLTDPHTTVVPRKFNSSWLIHGHRAR